MDEALLGEQAAAVFPEGESWFVVNARVAPWWRSDDFGATALFEGRTDFPELGVRLRVLWSGQPNGMYHSKHIFVGAGERPCVILTMGARHGEEVFRYPVSELARRHGATVEAETTQPDEAYARFSEGEIGPMPDGALPE